MRRQALIGWEYCSNSIILFMRICIGVITRDRPQMLKELLESFAEMNLPEETEIGYAVVENADSKSLDQVITAALPGAEVYYENESRRGIPFARNRVVEIGLRNGYDLTAFVDDDEKVDPDWLEQIVLELQARDLDLVGGPIEIQELNCSLTIMQRIIWHNLFRRFKRVARRAEKHHREGKDYKVAIVTGNWLIRNSFLIRTGLRFDESLGVSGGSDVQFYREACRHGAKTGWAPKAMVKEKTPPERLSISYQYRRGRDQAISSYRIKNKKVTPRVVLNSISFSFVKLVSALVLWIFVLPTLGKTLTDSVRSFGFAVGRIKALLGHKSTQYKSVQGN